MRYEYIGPFVDSTIKVLDSVIQSDIAKGDISLVRSDEINNEIAIMIRLKGDSEGSIILNMDTETAIRVCSLMNGEDFNCLTPIAMDTISELANMIAGKATSALNDMGFDFNVCPPLIAKENDISSKTLQVEIFQIPLYTEYGEITINVALRTD